MTTFISDPFKTPFHAFGVPIILINYPVAKLNVLLTHNNGTFRDRFVSRNLQNVLCQTTGADPEILKGGCTKFSGPELPYSGFDAFLNLL